MLASICPAGEYKLSVRAPGDADRKPEMAATTVSAFGGNVEGVLLVAGAGGTIGGRIVSDLGTPPAFKDVTKLRVSGRAVDPTRTYSAYSQDNGRVRDDWTFEVTDLMGPERLAVAALPSGWAVRSIEYDSSTSGTATGTSRPTSRSCASVPRG